MSSSDVQQMNMLNIFSHRSHLYSFSLILHRSNLIVKRSYESSVSPCFHLISVCWNNQICLMAIFISISTSNYHPQLSWGKVIFSEACVKNSVHRGGVSKPTPKGDVEGSGWGVSRPTPRGSPGPHPGGVSRPRPWGEVSQHALRQTPPSRRLLLWAVRILLECILVSTILLNWSQEIIIWNNKYWYVVLVTGY